MLSFRRVDRCRDALLVDVVLVVDFTFGHFVFVNEFSYRYYR